MKRAIKTFQIGYKLFYGETSEWGTETIRAETKQQALMDFAKSRSISKQSLLHYANWE